VVESPVATGRNIRARGVDFAEGEVLLKAGTRLDFRTLSLAAAMNHATLPVHRKPRVAILATGDELRAPGSVLGPDQIVASNAYGVAEIVRVCGGEPIDHGIAPDIEAEIAARTVAAARDADVLVTLGGASVGDHDYVQQALGSEGMELGFWKIAMRPGKPLIFGRLGATRVLGLPGNPVSSLVCALLYLKPLLQVLTGDAAPPASEVCARLGAAMKPNDQRQDYVRARLDRAPDGGWIATPHTSQDSSLLGILAGSGGLIVRPPGAPAADAGEACRVVLMQG
ncbi:MAG: molybdopterin molybdotransferase MoeA, partial [Tabrizicola sp.]|nr:molybdopterin molybdotransferase MoeA [Tabrizicola sp.]